MLCPDNSAEYDIEVGKRLAALRRSNSMTQTDAAKAAGITQSSISLIEKGKRTLTGRTALVLAEVYNASLEDILGSPNRKPFAPPSPGEAEALLQQLLSAPELSDIRESASVYTAVAAYRLFRTLYECNPHNGSELFSLSRSDADILTASFLKEESARTASAAAARKASVRSSLELPPEYSARVRSFIKTCEEFLTRSDEQQPPKNIR